MLKIQLNSKNIVITLAVFILLIFLHFIGVLRPVEGLLVRIFSPVSETFYSVGSNIRDNFSSRAEKKDLNLEIEELERENRRLFAQNAELKTLEEENGYLRSQLEFSQSNDYNYFLSEIISRNDLMNNSAEEKSLIINKGSNDGIQVGLAVIDGQGVVVGKVIETKESISRVCLTVDRKCKFAASIQNEDRTSGVVEGELGLTIKMDLVPQTEELKEGDVVVTSGLENNIPRGLAIGTISEVIRENNDLWQRAVIDPLADFDDLTMVSVVSQN